MPKAVGLSGSAPGGSVGREGEPLPGEVGNIPWNVGNDRGRSQGLRGVTLEKTRHERWGEVTTDP